MKPEYDIPTVSQHDNRVQAYFMSQVPFKLHATFIQVKKLMQANRAAEVPEDLMKAYEEVIRITEDTEAPKLHLADLYFCACSKMEKQQDKLSAEQIEFLESIPDWIWEETDEEFNAMLALIKDFQQTYGRLPEAEPASEAAKQGAK